MIWDMEYADSVIPLSYLYIGPRRLVQKGIIIVIGDVIRAKLCEHVTLHENYETCLIKCHKVSKCGDSLTHRFDQQAWSL